MVALVLPASDEATSPSPEFVIGSIMPSSVGASASASAYGFTVNAAYDYEFKNGLFMVLPTRITRQCNGTRWMATYHMTKTGTLTVTDGSNSASVSGSASVKGDLKALVAIYSWKTAHDGFYAGGGLGAALVSDEIKSIGGDTSILKRDWRSSYWNRTSWIGWQAAVMSQ